jgi:GntR family transcriptional regulator
MDAPSPVVRSSPVPLYLQIEEELRERVRSGELRPLDRVPSEIELAESFGVSRMTARKSLDRLVGDGLLFRRAGKGTFVAAGKIAHRASTRMSFSAAMDALGLENSTTVLEAGLGPAPPGIAKALREPPDASLVFVRRLRAVGGESAAIHSSYLPPWLAAILDADLSGSLSEAMTRLGARVAETQDTIEAVSSTGEDARLLGIPLGAALIRIEGLGLSVAGEPVRYTEALFRGDRFRFTVTSSDANDFRVELKQRSS